MLLEHLLFALGVTAPIFVILCVGIVLKRIGMIDNEFARMGSELVFKVTLPCMLFVKLVDTSLVDVPLALLSYAVLSTVLVFLVLDYGIAPRLLPADRGAFVQGAFRGNMGIIGLAYCLNAYGETIVPIASLYLAVMTILFNILSVITLNRHAIATLVNGQPAKWLVIKNILSNPLIIAIITALSFSWFSIRVPATALEIMDYLGSMTLPLALLCAGAGIRWREFHTSTTLYWAVFAKLLVVPAVMVGGAILLGFRGEVLGLLYYMASAPTASASYPMVRALGGNHYLAVAVIATTSLGSVVAITAGGFLLRSLGLL